MASAADWKAQKNVEDEKEWSTFDEEAQGVHFSQLKIVLRGYGSGKPIGMKTLRINSTKPAKPAKASSKSNSIALPSLALEEDSDEDADALPSMKTASSSILQDRLAELKEKLNKEETEKPAPAPLAAEPSSISFVVNVANKDEFDPNYEANKMKVDEAPIPKPFAPRAPKPAPEAPTTKPLAHVVLAVSGIGPERAEIRTTLTELGGNYVQDLPSVALPGQQLILLVDATSDQWHNTPKHTQAVAQNVPVVDKSWISACKKRGQFLAIGPYLPQFRTGEGKITPTHAAAGASTAKPTALALQPAPASKAKKGSIKAEGGSYSTDKPAKGDEVESDGPDEYVFDDFVVRDEDEIEYYDDADYGMEIDDAWGGASHHAKPKAPKVLAKNVPARVVFTPLQVQDKLDNWKRKCEQIFGKKVAAPPAKKEEVVTAFGMDVDDAASDGTNPIDAAELAELNRDL